MSGIQKIARKTGSCLQCRRDRIVYFLPEQTARKVNCRQCHLPLSLSEAVIVETWMTDAWAIMPIARKVTPEDVALFRRREELLRPIPTWEQVSLGIAPVRVEHGLVILRRTSWRCCRCGSNNRKFCLTEFAERRLSCFVCGNQVSRPKTDELRAGLTDDGTCCVIASLNPLAPVIIDKPGDLSVMSKEDLELIGIL